MQESECIVNEDFLALIEGMLCNDSLLIIVDYYLEESFSLFNIRTGEFYGRFGKIGQGPGEIPLGCFGNLENNIFTIFNNYTGLIAAYNIDSLKINTHFEPVKRMNYQIPDAFFSRIIPINDSLFLGAGVYKSKFQYALFDKTNKIIDSDIEIYNAHDENFNVDQKHLSNQGILKKHPAKNQFVYSVLNSSNIDFIDVSNNKINLIQSLHLRNPKLKPIQNDGFNTVIPDRDNSIGYIDIATSHQYIYALYTNKTLVNEDDTGNTYSSDIVLVFDWQGNPIKKYKLTKEAYYITVNEKINKLYAATINEEEGWSIISYQM
jgi:hypothetical protein